MIVICYSVELKTFSLPSLLLSFWFMWSSVCDTDFSVLISMLCISELSSYHCGWARWPRTHKAQGCRGSVGSCCHFHVRSRDALRTGTVKSLLHYFSPISTCKLRSPSSFITIAPALRVGHYGFHTTLANTVKPHSCCFHARFFTWER